VIALLGILAASALGSLHCVAMCGPLASIGSLRLGLLHSLGRLVTYATLGAAAGAVGNAVNVAGHLASVQRTAMLVSGVMIIAIAIAPAIRRDASRSLFGRGLVRIRSKRSARTRAALMGMLTGLLPCGWLWAFVVTAGGTGHVLGGLSVMVFFWLGTVPAMVGLLGFLGPAIGRLRARMPAITAVALIAIGLGTLALRWHDAGQATHCYLCHGGAS
jgi:sulfite exporter TauE/SafE